MGVDLNSEMWAAADIVGPPQRRRMEALGVSLSAMARLGQHQPPFGLQRVQESAGGLYEPAEDGPLYVIVPVMMAHTIDISGYAVDTAEIVDLIAFRSDKPMRWLWRTGDGWALGAGLLMHDAPIPLVAHPLDWLAAGGEAFCLLDWSLPPQRWRELREAPPLVTGDDMLRQRINKAYAASIPPLVPNPRIAARKETRNAA